MSPTATTVGGYLRDLPADRRVAMARVCSMIRRSARGVRESMRYGLAFYELQGPLFALESTEKRMTLFVAEPSVLDSYKSSFTNVIEERSAIEFTDLNRIPLDTLEKIVRDSVAARRERLKDGKAPTQKELLVLWKISEEEAKAPPPVVRISMKEDEPQDVLVEPNQTDESAEPVEILRAPTFKDPAMTASSQPKIKRIESPSSDVKKTVGRRKKASPASAQSEEAPAPKKKSTSCKKSTKTAAPQGGTESAERVLISEGQEPKKTTRRRTTKKTS